MVGNMWGRFFGRDPSSQQPDFFGLRILLGWIAFFLLVAFALIVTCADSWTLAATSLLWSLGLCAAGTILGFLFAIPRVVTEPNVPVPANHTVAGESELATALIREVRHNRLAANTNLEQVSDWLTKIIVGVGLIELSEIPGLIDRLALTMSPSFGIVPLSMSIATSIIILFTASGFLIGYVTTRAFLPHILETTERQAVERIRSQLPPQTKQE